MAEQVPDELDLSRLLAPRSLAVVGDARLGARVLEKTERLGFVGPLWAVHPSGRVGRHEAVTSVSALPEGPDAAFVAVPASAVPDVVGALAARRCGGAVVYSSGFAETGPAGRALQSEVLEAAGAMPILGPNCYGLLNYVDGMAIWPDEHGGTLLPSAEQQHEQRGVALVSQSSSIAISLTMQDIGLPLAHVLTVGNAAALGPWQLARALTRRPEVSAIGLVVESLHDLRGIEALARASRETATPVVALVLGRSVQAQRVVLSHSASMASDAAVGADLLNRCGIGRVECVDSLLGTLSLLHCGGPLSGGALTSLSSSGGEAALVADSCVETGVGFADLSPGQRDALGRALGPRVTLDNPLDYHTYVWGDLAAMRETFVAMTQGPGDLHLLFADIPRDDRCDPGDWLLATQAFAQALTQTGARGHSSLRWPRICAGSAPCSGCGTVCRCSPRSASRSTPRRWPPPSGRRGHDLPPRRSTAAATTRRTATAARTAGRSVALTTSWTSPARNGCSRVTARGSPRAGSRRTRRRRSRSPR